MTSDATRRTDMATYVLVHGGGHGGWCYQRVARILRSHGHEVHAPSLSGLGERSHLLGPDIDLDTHITDITSLLHSEDLHDVVLVGHSYGGMVITGVADRATDRIGDLVYLDAANPQNGQSLVDVVIHFRRPCRPVLESPASKPFAQPPRIDPEIDQPLQTAGLRGCAVRSLGGSHRTTDRGPLESPFGFLPLPMQRWAISRIPSDFLPGRCSPATKLPG